MKSAPSNLERSVVVVSPKNELRDRLHRSLSSMRWHVREARGGAEAMAHLEESSAEAMIVDEWLPDLEVNGFCQVLSELYPGLDIVLVGDRSSSGSYRSPRRHELQHALREAESRSLFCGEVVSIGQSERELANAITEPDQNERSRSFPEDAASDLKGVKSRLNLPSIPGLIGRSEAMRELSRLISLVASHEARVLIEGETGTGKELVAKAIHSMSKRSKHSFIVLNCAAIPEALLEAELFGHTKGAFTGAVQSRVGRIEAAHGGTLFLDEIGEMPFALQAKLLRFLENGEVQKVGDNEATQVDVRVLAATHQDLDSCVLERSFRLDLLHRLSVFPIVVPSLRERLDDIELLADHFLERLGRELPRKRLTQEALARLRQHSWPGNVRELGHVLQRAAILSEDRIDITASDIRVRRQERRSEP